MSTAHEAFALDAFNAELARDAEVVDRINSEFYGKILFPWAPATLERLASPTHAIKMVGHDVGRYAEGILPLRGARIWAAGCGTNQALVTALRFPTAQVVGSDLSAESLALCRTTADAVGVRNLELRHESINGVEYRDEFDLVVCTGVVHHNADPETPVRRLRDAVKPAGLVEFMVYNRYHRIQTTAFQKALRALARGSSDAVDVEREAALARSLIRSFDVECEMKRFLSEFEGLPDAHFADALLQPVEYSYTVASLDQLLRRCGLELWAPLTDAFSRSFGETDWNLDFADASLQQRYEALPDVARWQVTNLLRGETSPMLWFYLRRDDSPYGSDCEAEAERCRRFAETRFRPTRTLKQLYRRDAAGGYAASGKARPFPGIPSDPRARAVYEALDPEAPLADAIDRAGLDRRLPTLSHLRGHLATTGYPYLEAC